MQSLATKYRPRTFEECLSQRSVITILKNQLAKEQYTNCYGFCGPSGCGKTTIARIFGNMINKGKGEIFEIDGASNNGVENIRKIIDEANTRAIDGSEYKIFIIDECFTEDALVTTENGYKKIKDIQVGDKVATMTGFNRVTYVHKKPVKNRTLNLIKLSNGQSIKVTEDHLFMTTEGWIEARNLIKGDVLIDYDNLSKLWKVDFNQEKNSEILQQQMSSRISKKDESEGFDFSYLSDLWKYFLRGKREQQKEDLLKGMSGLVNIAIREDNNEFRIWNGTKETIIRKNEAEQSDAQARKYSENAEYERIDWESSCVEGSSWGKWRIYKRADKAVECFKQFLNLGISSENSLSKNQSSTLSYSIQSRPWLSRVKVSDRGGWQQPQIEISYCEGFKENYLSSGIRVESGEIYQRGDNERLGESTEDYTVLYDLTVGNCPSYFVNDILVHNCHMITTAGWNAFLKTIEEPPKYSIFMFCTTNPEKMPATITNRIMKFNLTKVETPLIKSRLEYICQQEGFTNYEAACDYISKLSQGGVRDAISLLDKVANYNTDLSIENVLECLGDFSYDSFFNLTLNLLNQDEGSVLSAINDYYNQGKDLKLFVDQYLDFALDLAKYCLYNDIRYVKIPSNLDARCKGYASIPNILDWTNNLIGRVLDIKNLIKYDVNAKTTIEASFIALSRGV